MSSPNSAAAGTGTAMLNRGVSAGASIGATTVGTTTSPCAKGRASELPVVAASVIMWRPTDIGLDAPSLGRAAAVRDAPAATSSCAASSAQGKGSAPRTWAWWRGDTSVPHGRYVGTFNCRTQGSNASGHCAPGRCGASNDGTVSLTSTAPAVPVGEAGSLSAEPAEREPDGTLLSDPPEHKEAPEGGIMHAFSPGG